MKTGTGAGFERLETDPWSSLTLMARRMTMRENFVVLSPLVSSD